METIRKGIKISYSLMLIKAILTLLPVFTGIYLMLRSFGVIGWLGDVFSGNTHSVTVGFEVLFSPLAGIVGVLMIFAALIIFLVFGIAFAVNFISFKHSKKIYKRIFLHIGEDSSDIPTVLIKDCVQRIIIMAIDIVYKLILAMIGNISLKILFPTLLPIILFSGFQVFLILECRKIKV